ncbi:hypothetical protein HPO96_36760 [Kribbella sandramycini]|uniref:Uncharacterized protein n=1 Tax=Kribbella sandramycini TaxID=60450 RepID=A0A7Y4L7F9_9ACTN|nr:hypothetical protein [Kribbella sandramycini]MBB6570272.1 hypothetical protein [Kribbella sandramycini]NOL45810.1 hypothetical protein [Kribbella sandramycini]
MQSLWLARKIRKNTDRLAFAKAAKLIYSSPGDTGKILELFGERRDPEFTSNVLYGLQHASHTNHTEGHRPVPDVPPAVAAFLRDRFPEYLTQQGSTLVGRHDLAEWIVDAALKSTDAQARAELAALLSATDQPKLLDQLARAFSTAIHNEQGGYDSKVRLWTNREPTELTRILLANPNLPTPLTDEERATRGSYVSAANAVLAVFKGRLDRLPDFLLPQYATATVRDLLAAIDLPAPADFVERCRRVLRELPPGPAREHVVFEAIHAKPEAVAAAADARYAPENERDALVFLYITGQWDRYDEADPDGSKLIAYCAEHARPYVGTYRHQIERAAQASGRPDPCPKLPKPRPNPNPFRPYQSGGSWPTDPGGGSGGFSGGGSF